MHRKLVPLPAWNRSDVLTSGEATEAQSVTSRPEPCPCPALTSWVTSLGLPVLIWKTGLTSVFHTCPRPLQGLRPTRPGFCVL